MDSFLLAMTYEQSQTTSLPFELLHNSSAETLRDHPNISHNSHNLKKPSLFLNVIPLMCIVG